MIINNLGPDVWVQVEKELRKVASRLLLLEYNEHGNDDVVE